MLAKLSAAQAMRREAVVKNETRRCPRCNYENLPQAVYCFRCNRRLDDLPVVDGLDGTGSLIEGALRFIRQRNHSLFEPGRIERLRKARSKVLPENLNGEPLTCLNCGTYNLPDATHCVHCNAPLLIPDEDFGIQLRLSGRTSVGKVRANNEDSLGLWAIDGLALALVADGMGGAAAGEEASRLVVEAVQANFTSAERGSDQLATLSEELLLKRLHDAIDQANRTVVERARRDASRRGMGTTATLALVRNNRVFVAHVGDSRLYLVDAHDRTIIQITSDHSFVQALVASGHLTAEQARYHPMGHVLYRALGQSADLEIDLFRHTLREGDRIVVCSDGLTRHLEDKDIAEIVLRTDNPTEATLDLIELTNERGGEDNVSVIVLYLERVGQA
ncbi:MAG: protein phosphatase [Candidatus Thermofonsia Clade 1 bacterium]|uniref:Protein phosphatase n=1 Tax=Candidatus Thermofonsia Clade 1 bacterium TaxID=2364210 RepID=A0A2M8PXK8_9CHLR|nr:MAG: protein phosphatase [Candidatus Thermofonsia Clade 1 bacterium]PJF42281.1 MAG: protein phosphatase [Candidatus Thermofonsia Clade 1 bacterium]